MSDLTWWTHFAAQFKDWVTSIAFVLGGTWALWVFYFKEWRPAGIASLEGGSIAPEICALGDGRAAVSLRWTWRNVGTRPVYLDTENTIVEVYRLEGDIGNFVDPRQIKKPLIPLKVGDHLPLADFGGFYRLEPGTTSSIPTVLILPLGKAFIARIELIAHDAHHRTGGDWSYSWERWQIFRTDLPTASVSIPPRRSVGKGAAPS
jgi:hypothetical protein